MAQADQNDPTRAEEEWTPGKLIAMFVVTIVIVLFILYKISP